MTLQNKQLYKILIACGVVIFSFVPLLTFAQDGPSKFLIGIPGISGEDFNFNGYINAIYALFISIAALLAVVKIIVAGVKYMFSDIITQKSEAKKDIRGALLGLVVILGAVLILNLINPNLTEFSLDVKSLDPSPEQVQGVLNQITTNQSGRSIIPTNSHARVQLMFAEQCAERENHQLIRTTVNISCIRKGLTEKETSVAQKVSTEEIDILIQTYVDPFRSELAEATIAELLDVDQVYFSVDSIDMTDDGKQQIDNICSILVTQDGGVYKGVDDQVEEASLIINRGSNTTEDQLICISNPTDAS